MQVAYLSLAFFVKTDMSGVEQTLAKQLYSLSLIIADQTLILLEEPFCLVAYWGFLYNGICNINM